MKKIIIFIITILFVSCATSKLTKRYKEMETGSISEFDNYIRVNAFSLDVGKTSASKSIFDLSEKAQAKLIEEVAKKAKTNEEIYSKLNAKFINKQKSTSEISKTVFSKRVVISVENLKNLNGANRLESLTTFIEHKKNKLIFQYWDKIVTQYQEIDIGKQSYSNTGGFTISPDINMAGTIQGNAPISTTYSATSTEEVLLKTKFPSITGALSSHKLWVTRKSAQMEDISGNILIEVKFKASKTASKNVYVIENLFVKNLPNNDNSKIKVNKTNFEFADIKPDDSEVELIIDILYREVNDGANTFTESDDNVKLLAGKSSKSIKFNLLDESDLKTKFWLIKNGNDVLSITTKTGNADNLRFNSFNAAEQFLKWLFTTNNTYVSDYIIGFQKGTKFQVIKLNEIPILNVEIE